MNTEVFRSRTRMYVRILNYQNPYVDKPRIGKQAISMKIAKTWSQRQ